MNLEYYIYLAFVVAWILSMLRAFGYRRLGSKVENSRKATPPDATLPAFSVIITAHDQCMELRRNLPLILNQIYPRFEVIVVDMSSTDGTKKMLEKLEEEHMNLHHTFTPSTGRDISTVRLAITLGVKAATNPWIVITQANCSPISHLWLRRLGESIAGHRAAVMAVGHTRFDKVRGYTERRMRFFRLWQQILTYNFANKHSMYRCDGTNLAYKKELFLSHQGFASHANLLTGACDIMVNQQSTRHNTALCLHPEAVIEQQMTSHKHWNQDRLYFQETRRHFSHKWLYRLRYFGSMLLHSLLEVTCAASIGMAVWKEQYIIGGVALLLWFVHLIHQSVMFNTSAKALDDRKINFIRVEWFIHLIPFWDLKAWLRHAFGDKRRYRKKYI